MEAETLPTGNGQKVLTALGVALQKIEILEAIPELCNRILARDINLETVLGEETSLELLHLALLRRKWEKCEYDENIGFERQSSSEGTLEWGSRDSGNWREWSGSNSISAWNGSVARKGIRGKGKDRIAVCPGVCDREEHGVEKDFGCESGIKKMENGRRVSCEDVLEVEELCRRKKRLAVAMLRSDSSQVTFLRDVINASVTNALATNKHSEVWSVEGAREGNDFLGAGEAGEEIDGSDMSHSTSPRCNNMMQLIRQALHSKYGDHTRQCIKERDAKALLCILSLIDPHHCFTVTPTANPIKGTKSKGPENYRGTRGSNSSPNPNPSHPSLPEHALKSTSQTQTSIPQEHLCQRLDEQLLSPPSSSPNTKNTPISDTQYHYHTENETKAEIIPVSISLTNTNRKLYQGNGEYLLLEDSEEIRTRKLNLKKYKTESFCLSLDRVLETIQELEYHDQDYSQFQQFMSQRQTLISTPPSTNQEQETSSGQTQQLKTEYSREMSSQSQASQLSLNGKKEIVKIPMLDENPGSRTSNSSADSNNQLCHSKQNIISEFKSASSEAMIEYCAQIEQLNDQNGSDTSLMRKSTSNRSVSLNILSDDNYTSPAITSEPKWFKDVGSEFSSKDSLGRQIQELFRNIFNDFMLKAPALEFVKRIRTEMREKNTFSNHNNDLSICNLERTWLPNGTNGKCSEGLSEMKTLLDQLNNLMKARLLSSFQDEEKQIKYCRKLWIMEQRNVQKIQKIQKDLESTAAWWTPKISLLDSEIVELQNELKKMPDKSLHGVSLEIMEGLKTDLKLRKIYAIKSEETSERMTAVKNALDCATQANFSAECKFRKRQYKKY